MCIRGKSTVRVDKHTGGLRPRGSLNPFYGAFLSGFRWPIIWLCLVLRPRLVYLRVLLCVCISWPSWILVKRPVGALHHWLWCEAPLLTSEKPSCTCIVGKVSLTSRMRTIWFLISYLGRAQPPLSIVLLFIFWSFCPQGMDSICLPCWGWGGGVSPPISCLTSRTGSYRATSPWVLLSTDTASTSHPSFLLPLSYYTWFSVTKRDYYTMSYILYYRPHGL